MSLVSILQITVLLHGESSRRDEAGPGLREQLSFRYSCHFVFLHLHRLLVFIANIYLGNFTFMLLLDKDHEAGDDRAELNGCGSRGRKG